MKTAVQQVFSELETLFPNYFNVYTTEGKEFINHFHKYLAIEKEQIKSAFTKGDLFAEDYFYPEKPNIDCSENYYNETFKPESNESV